MRALAGGLAAAILACSVGTVRAQHAFNLPPAVDLQADAANAKAKGVPILLFFDRDDCPYCERALREFLVPMSKDPQWGAQAIYRQVEIDRPKLLVDFNGAKTTHADYARGFSIRLTPTIVMVGPHGETLGDPLVGLLTVDFYSAYLEDTITRAREKLE